MHKVKVWANDREIGIREHAIMDLQIGGQALYDDGPSVLLSLQDPNRLIEVQIPFELVNQLVEELISRRDSWDDMNRDIESRHECKCNDLGDCEECADYLESRQESVGFAAFAGYKTVNIRNFTEVHQMLANGWKPWGSPCKDANGSIIQAFVKRG